MKTFIQAASIVSLVILASLIICQYLPDHLLSFLPI